MSTHPLDPAAARDDAAWYRALTLAERRQSGAPASAGGDASRADQRLQRWRSQPPFDQPDLFRQRLALDQLSQQELHALLGEPAHELAARQSTTPAWLQAIHAWLSAPADDWQLPEAVVTQPHGQLLTPCAPLLHRALRQFSASLSAAIGQQSSSESITRLTATLFGQLAPRLLPMLSRTLVLELNVARVQGRLSGTTPAARFDSFIEELRQPEIVQNLLREYPVLARLLVEEVARWHEASLEFATRLVADRPELERWLDTALPLEQISAIRPAGDRHRGGRTVQLVQWSNGARLVYKPRSLAVDRHMQQLVAWLNEHGTTPPLEAAPVLDRDRYGWAGWVASAECDSVAQIWRFYQRQGAYLALLHLLGATDLHAENIIAAGEHPIMIDLEALLQPERAVEPLEQAQPRARQRLAHSVLRVGLLPQRIQQGRADPGVEIGGLGSAGGQRLARARMRWADAGTDTMRLVIEDAVTSDEQNRPRLRGQPVDPLAWHATIEQSFGRMYQLLIDQRAALLAADGPLAGFSSAEVRLILRPTATYERLRLAALHPDVLRDALDRERLLDRLYVEVAREPALAGVLGAERAALQAGDIPLFTIRADELELLAGNQTIPAFVTRSGSAGVQQRLQQLGPDDHDWQRWVIRAALATFTGSAAHVGREQPPGPLPAAAATSDELLAAASRVGGRLQALSVRGRDDATWLGLIYRPGSTWQLAPLDSDLHSGLAGVALFLAYLGAQTGQQRTTDLAEAALAALRRQIARQRGRRTQIGALSGWGGIIYSLAHLGQLWRAPVLLDEAEQIAVELPPLIDSDSALDLMDGAAGCALSLLALAAVRPTPALHELLRRCGERLRVTALPMAIGYGWPAPDGSPPLAGLSHGAAGVAWALQQIATTTGMPELAELALEALRYERSLFVAERGNWPDLRTEPARFMIGWCHGAAGIGLSRLQMLPSSTDPQLRAEIEVALSTTLRDGWGRSHALCHGDLGNLELLLQAGTAGLLADWQSIVGRLAARVLHEERAGWRCGLSLPVETPGLMIGLAGIGYGLLRLAAPAAVPAVLTLAPPAPNL